MRPIGKNVFKTTVDIVDKSEADIARDTVTVYLLSPKYDIEMWNMGQGGWSIVLMLLPTTGKTSLFLLSQKQRCEEPSKLPCRNISWQIGSWSFKDSSAFWRTHRRFIRPVNDENSHLSHLHCIIAMWHFQRWHNDVISNEIIWKKRRVSHCSNRKSV